MGVLFLLSNITIRAKVEEIENSTSCGVICQHYSPSCRHWTRSFALPFVIIAIALWGWWHHPLTDTLWRTEDTDPKNQLWKWQSQDLSQGHSDLQTMLFPLLHPQIPSYHEFLSIILPQERLFFFFLTLTLAWTKVNLEDINKWRGSESTRQPAPHGLSAHPDLEHCLRQHLGGTWYFQSGIQDFQPQWYVEDETECSPVSTLWKSKDGFRTAFPWLLIFQHLEGESHWLGWKFEWYLFLPFCSLRWNFLLTRIVSEPHMCSVLAL